MAYAGSMTPPPLDVVHAFVDAINRADIDALGRLMTEDHVFTDGSGAAVGGRETMKAAWKAYFAMVPAYEHEIEETYVQGAVVILLGSARGTYRGEAWSTPAAWRAKLRDGLIAEWRVYTDNEPIRALMRKGG